MYCVYVLRYVHNMYLCTMSMHCTCTVHVYVHMYVQHELSFHTYVHQQRWWWTRQECWKPNRGQMNWNRGWVPRSASVYIRMPLGICIRTYVHTCCGDIAACAAGRMYTVLAFSSRPTNRVFEAFVVCFLTTCACVRTYIHYVHILIAVYQWVLNICVVCTVAKRGTGEKQSWSRSGHSERKVTTNWIAQFSSSRTVQGTVGKANRRRMSYIYLSEFLMQDLCMNTYMYMVYLGFTLGAYPCTYVCTYICTYVRMWTCNYVCSIHVHMSGIEGRTSEVYTVLHVHLTGKMSYFLVAVLNKYTYTCMSSTYVHTFFMPSQLS